MVTALSGLNMDDFSHFDWLFKKNKTFTEKIYKDWQILLFYSFVTGKKMKTDSGYMSKIQNLDFCEKMQRDVASFTHQEQVSAELNEQRN